jgi:hypothetical protein
MKWAAIGFGLGAVVLLVPALFYYLGQRDPVAELAIDANMLTAPALALSRPDSYRPFTYQRKIDP